MTQQKPSFKIGEAPKKELEKIAKEFDDTGYFALYQDCQEQLSKYNSGALVHRRNGYAFYLSLHKSSLQKSPSELPCDLYSLKMKDLQSIRLMEYENLLKAVYFIRKDLGLKV